VSSVLTKLLMAATAIIRRGSLMTLDIVRALCRSFPGTTEDIKWGHDLCFSVSGKMFVVVNLEPPHSIAFKCTPETFAELIERPGIIPAPYMARNMWVMEEEFGTALTRRELEALMKTSYALVRAKLPKRTQALIESGGSSRVARRRKNLGAPADLSGNSAVNKAPLGFVVHSGRRGPSS
jgi:predicted DNA-binding protein (MmcQ/YjbR family)